MRNAERLDYFYNEICRLHKKYLCDWRFNQMIINYLSWHLGKFGNDGFYVEEDDIAWMESTDDLKQRDIIKTQYCLQHNIPIIRIPNVKLDDITIQDLSLDSKYLLRSGERFED